jgi:putative intracellular protease/amidase
MRFSSFPIAFLFLLTMACNSSEQESSSVKTTQEDKQTPKILFVLTSHDQKGNTGEKTGFFLSEAAHPWEVLHKEYEIEFVSPQGGKAPVDGKDLEDTVNAVFWNDSTIQYKITHTKKPEDIDASQYKAIHFVGGHGAMWDFPDNETLSTIAAEIYEQGGVVSAVCHGPAGLVNIKLHSGEYLIKGKRVTGFTNDEERAVDLTDVVPFLLEDKLIDRGAHFTQAEKFTVNVAHDGRLITGQNPQSALQLGKEIKAELAEVK